MIMNLKSTPYSYRSSYMAFSEIPGMFNGMPIEEGLYFRSIHGSSKTSMVAMMKPLTGNKKCEYTTGVTPYKMTINTKDAQTEVTFYDAKTVLLCGNVPITFDFMSENRPYTYLVPQDVNNEYWMADCYGENCRYMIHAQSGQITVDQDWSGCNAKKSNLTISAGNDEKYLIVIEEFLENWEKSDRVYDFDKTVERCKETFTSFKELMPEIPAKYDDLAEVAAYVNWESLVAPYGFLKREAMLMSKNWMCNVWSWDHCFNALALAYKAPRMAWDQFMIMFDFQTAIGCLPDSVNDSKIIHNYCKPPIYGWMLRKMMQIMEISDEQLLDAYDKLCKWTKWWLTCRDNNNDGLCEYNHGNDSGWDNSTAFSEMPPTTTPDLAAFLILQMDVLRELAERFGKADEVAFWNEKSDAMLANMLEKLYENGEPHALDGLDNRVHRCDTLLFYLPLILGNRLPEEIRKKGIATLKSDKFVTANGFATESPASSLYEDDGYWRGPIWAPSTFIIIDGLTECGEYDFAKEMVEKFCDMMSKSGCAENFDAITGEGLRDLAYTWTASVMFVLAHEYLMI